MLAKATKPSKSAETRVGSAKQSRLKNKGNSKDCKQSQSNPESGPLSLYGRLEISDCESKTIQNHKDSGSQSDEKNQKNQKEICVSEDSLIEEILSPSTDKISFISLDMEETSIYRTHQDIFSALRSQEERLRQEFEQEREKMQVR